MSDRRQWFVIACLASGAFGILFGVWFTEGVYVRSNRELKSSYEEFRQSALDHGAAYYRCDPKTGKVEFVWREIPVE